MSTEKRDSMTAEKLRAVFDYDRETGAFTWRVIQGPMRPGDVAGYKNSYGYIKIAFDGCVFAAHRLAWLYEYGSWPVQEIDHINGVRDDNRIANLRDTSRRENTENKRKAQSNNRTGFLGVRPHRGRFEANIRSKGKVTFLGSYGTPEEAHSAYVNAKRAIHAGNTL